VEQQPSTRPPRRTAAPQPRPAADDAYDVPGPYDAADAERADARYPSDSANSPRFPARVRPERPSRPVRPGSDRPPATLGSRPPVLRLTGLGTGLLATVAMLAAGCLDAVLLSGSPAAYGVVFLLVACAGGLRIRPAELVAAPVSMPLAFTVGVVPINDGEDGLSGQVVGVFTSLSLEAGWLYAGTLLTSLIVLVRRAVLVSRRRPGPSGKPPQPPSRLARFPRCSGAERGRSRP
jgi:hypothetical protein